MPVNNIRRWTESAPRSGWWHSHIAGIYSDCSTRKINNPVVAPHVQSLLCDCTKETAAVICHFISTKALMKGTWDQLTVTVGSICMKPDTLYGLIQQSCGCLQGGKGVRGCVDQYSALLSRTMHWHRANKYVSSRHLKQSELLIGSRIKSKKEFQQQTKADREKGCKTTYFRWRPLRMTRRCQTDVTVAVGTLVGLSRSRRREDSDSMCLAAAEWWTVADADLRAPWWRAVPPVTRQHAQWGQVYRRRRYALAGSLPHCKHNQRELPH